MAEYIVAIDVTRVSMPGWCIWRLAKEAEEEEEVEEEGEEEGEGRIVLGRRLTGMC